MTNEERLTIALEVLRELEFHDEANHPTIGAGIINVCPICTGRGDRAFHYPGCKLAVALGRQKADNAKKKEGGT